MKSLIIVFFFCFSLSAIAQELAILQSIDDFDMPDNYIEVSEEALPTSLFEELMAQLSSFQFTSLEETSALDLFMMLKKDPKARMERPGGLCAHRRVYIQSLLKKRKVVSGQLLIECPANDGHLRLRDQVSGRYFSYSNFHDANIITILTERGIKFRILDLQFEDGPVTLEDYLARLRHLKRFVQ